MKSPTSLIRFRNAVGVMLALSAIFAVVISTISMPGDRAIAQVPDADTDAIAARAAAWWNALTPMQRTNALLGKDYDDITDDATATPPNEGRDLPESANEDYADLADEPDPPTPLDPTSTGQVIDKGDVNALVDGSADASTVDIYAVGEHIDGITNAIRGFQSVEVWWDYIDCAEARIAVGEDSDDLITTDADADTDGFQAESSTVCDATLNTAGDAVASTSVKPYDELGDAKAQVDRVGQAILGLDAPGSANSTTHARAKAWWDSLPGPSDKTQALYGTSAIPGLTPPATGTVVAVGRVWIAGENNYDEIANPSTIRGKVTPDATDEFSLDTASQELANGVHELINDRWQYIYHMGGMNEMNKDEVIYWWDSIDSGQRRIATGTQNEPEGTPSTSGYGLGWDALQDTELSQAGKARHERVFKVGQAILGLKKLPDVAAWWNTLNADQMVYVVYGNPPMRTAYDDPDNPGTGITTVTDADKAVFQKMYADLTGGIEVGAADAELSTHLPAYVVEMLARNAPTDFTTTPTAVDTDGDDMWYYSAKDIVDAIANELFDPPAMLTAFVRPDGNLVTTSAEDAATTAGPVADDNDFDWPYNSDNKPASVADWWESTDCRVMRIAVGQDNNYLNGAVAAVEDAPNTADIDESMDAIPAETSIYCGHFVGSTDDRTEGSAGTLSKEAQMRVEEVGQALLGLSAPGRPSFNEPPKEDGHPLIMGTAQVGATLTVNTDPIEDEDGIPEDSDGDKVFQYQWLRNGTPISGATGSTYVLTAADAGATISVRVSYIDNERYPEMRTSPSSLATSQIVGAPGEISKIVESIRGVTISAGGDVVLSVNAYGLQGVQDNNLEAGMGLEWKEGDRSFDDDDTETPWEVTYTAPSSPGTYTITASFANDGDCRPLDKDGGEEMRDKLCTATFQVRVRREQPPVATPVPPVDPPGEIPSLIPDSDGNQYEVFTPVEGGTFDGGEGYSITVPSGAVPNGEYIGIRMSDDGAASNVGQVHQRYTLAGNMYGVHAVDASGAAISSYVLEAPAEVCVPLPAALRTNISHLSLAAINSDGTLTVLSAQVRLNGTGGDTMVCGNLSNLPASVAVGSQGAPAAPPTAVPTPEPVLPDTGGTSPASGSLVWALLLGTAVVVSGTFIVAGRRRKMVGSK